MKEVERDIDNKAWQAKDIMWSVCLVDLAP